MRREHSLSAEIGARHLVEVRLSALDGEAVVDAFFADARGDRLHLCFLGVVEVSLAGFTPGAAGHRVAEAAHRTVKLVPPRGRGLSLRARAVMSVD